MKGNLLMEGNHRCELKKIPFGKHNIAICTYFLSEFNSGLRVEVNKFSKTNTVDIVLVIGDDVLVKKHIYKRIVLEKPMRKTIQKEVQKLIDYAKRELIRK